MARGYRAGPCSSVNVLASYFKDCGELLKVLKRNNIFYVTWLPGRELNGVRLRGEKGE